MKPKRIILIRHGESIGQIDKTIYRETPDYAVPITEQGRKQIEKSAQEILEIFKGGPVYVYCSPFWRTRESYQELSKVIKVGRYYEDPRLREQEWGHLREIDYDIIQEKRDSYGHFYYRFPDGESCADVFDRISDFLNTLWRDFEKQSFPENIIIVTHGMTIRLFIMRFFHKSVEEFESWGNPKNGEYFILELNSEYDRYFLTNYPNKHNLKHNFQFVWRDNS